MMRKTTPSYMVVLVIYTDEIMLLDIDEANISTMKAYLHEYFVARALQTLANFLGIDFAHQQGEFALFQKEYALDLF